MKVWYVVKCATCKRDTATEIENEIRDCRWHTTTCTSCGSDAITDEQMRVFIHRTCHSCGFVSLLPPEPTEKKK